MTKSRRGMADKLKTLLFGKDLRVIQGDPYTQLREFDFSSYYPEDKYIYSQSIPTDNVYDIRKFGANINSEDNSAAINRTIAEAGKTGGTVLIDGGDYVSTTVTLISGVTLFICRNSSISANTTGKGYDKHGALLYAENADNITLTGGGKLKCNGHLFGREPVAERNNTTPPDYIDVIEMRRDSRTQLRFAHPSKYGCPIYFNKCNGIKVDNFIIENSAFWSFKISNGDDVDICNFVINNNRHVANADGIDISGSSNVNIHHCFISTADDGIVIKNAIWLGNNAPMKNITISDCEVISRANSIKVGTETTYDISNIKIHDCHLLMTDLYPGTVSGIALEACDGTVLSDVEISNITMERCTCPVFIRLGNRNRASVVNSATSNAIEFGKKVKFVPSAPKEMFDSKSQVKNINITGVKATGVEIPVIVAGYRQKGKTHYVENVTLKDFDLTYADIPETVDRRLFIPEYVDVYPESWRFRNLPAYAIWMRHVKNITIENFNCTHPQPTWKKDIIKKDVI